MPKQNYFKPRVADPYNGDDNLYYKITDQSGNIISKAAKLALVNSIQPGNEGTPVSANALNSLIAGVGTLTQVVHPSVLDDDWLPCDGSRIDENLYPLLAEIMPAKSTLPWSYTDAPWLGRKPLSRARLSRFSSTFYCISADPMSTGNYVTIYTSKYDPYHWGAACSVDAPPNYSNLVFANGYFAFLSYGDYVSKIHCCKAEELSPGPAARFTSYTLTSSSAAGSTLTYDERSDTWVYVSDKTLYYRKSTPTGAFTAVALGASVRGFYVGAGFCVMYEDADSNHFMKYIDLSSISGGVRDISQKLSITSARYPVCVSCANGYWIVQMCDGSKYSDLYYTSDLIGGTWKANKQNTLMTSAVQNIVHDGEYYYLGGMAYLRSRGKPDGVFSAIAQSVKNIEYADGYVYSPAPVTDSTARYETLRFHFAQSGGITPIIMDDRYYTYIKGR